MGEDVHMEPMMCDEHDAQSAPILPTLDGLPPDAHAVSLSGTVSHKTLQFSGPLKISGHVQLLVTAQVVAANFKWNEKEESLALVHTLKVLHVGDPPDDFDDDTPFG